MNSQESICRPHRHDRATVWRIRGWRRGYTGNVEMGVKLFEAFIFYFILFLIFKTHIIEVF
jgi:hypothetical protein